MYWGKCTKIKEKENQKNDKYDNEYIIKTSYKKIY